MPMQQTTTMMKTAIMPRRMRMVQQQPHAPTSTSASVSPSPPSSKRISAISLLPLRRLVLLVLACVLVLSSTLVSGDRAIAVSLVEAHGQCSTQMMEAAEVAYAIERPDLGLVGSTQDIVGMVTSLYALPSSIDFFVSGQQPGDVVHPEFTALIQGNPTSDNVIVSFPVAASAIVPIYNLPGQTAVPLLITRSMLVHILLGAITRWDDPALVALNPMIALPAMNITVVLPAGPLTQTLALTHALLKFDPLYNATIGPTASDQIAWPLAKYASYAITSGTLSSYTLTNPYTFSYALISNAVPLNVQRASMVNKAGQVVVAGTASINYAFLELGAKPDSITGVPMWVGDMSDGTGYEAWPMAFTIAVYLPVSSARTTCAARAEIVNFWLWFLASSVVQSIASQLSLSILPALVYTNLNLNDFLRSQLKCEGAAVANVPLNVVGFAGVNLATIYSDLLTSYLGFFGSTDATYTYQYTPQTELQAMQQLSAREIDGAMIVPTQFKAAYPGILEGHVIDAAMLASGLAPSELEAAGGGDLILFPYALYAVVPIHNLPPAVVAVYTGAYPLVVDLDTLGRIFSLDITSWTDATLERLNPGLIAAFTLAGASTKITLVVCCKVATMSAPATNALVQALNTTSSKFTARQPWALPVNWLAVANSAATRGLAMINVASEQQMEAAVVRTPGAIGYKLSYASVPVTTKEFAIRRLTAIGLPAPTLADADANPAIVQAQMTPTIANLQSCVDAVSQASLSLDYQLENLQPTNQASLAALAHCWPITIMASLVVPSTYTGDACSQGNHTLNLASWLLDESTLDSSSNARGILRLSSDAQMKALHQATLDEITCDGQTMLTVKPHVWVLSSGVTQFGWALCAMGLICVAVSAGIMVKYRQRSVLRSSSVPFQFVILFGLAVMFVAIGIFGSAPTTARCQSLAWLLNIGFTLMYGPLFAKMYRIYKIFDRKVLKVVKISNQKLALLPLAMVTKDVILNLVWQLYSPIYAAPILRTQNGDVWSYQQCTGDSHALPFLLIIVVLKFALLVFGSFMGFTTRNVASTFNESKNVAWAIYSVFFSVTIIVPILFFSNAIGDSFTILIVFLLFWIAATTLGLNFGSKFIVLFKSEDVSHHSSADGDQQQGGGSGAETGAGDVAQLFAFPSLAVLPKGVLDRYIGALEAQMRTAKQRHRALLEGDHGNEGGGGRVVTASKGPTGSRGANQSFLASKPQQPQPRSQAANNMSRTGQEGGGGGGGDHYRVMSTSTGGTTGDLDLHNTTTSQRPTPGRALTPTMTSINAATGPVTIHAAGAKPSTSPVNGGAGAGGGVHALKTHTSISQPGYPSTTRPDLQSQASVDGTKPTRFSSRASEAMQKLQQDTPTTEPIAATAAAGVAEPTAFSLQAAHPIMDVAAASAGAGGSAATATAAAAASSSGDIQWGDPIDPDRRLADAASPPPTEAEPLVPNGESSSSLSADPGAAGSTSAGSSKRASDEKPKGQDQDQGREGAM